MANVNRNTANTSLKRLERAGYLKKQVTRKGDPKVLGYGHIGQRAHSYELMVNDAELVTPIHTTRTKEGAENDKKRTDILKLGNDIWSYQGLANERRTYVALVNGHKTVNQIAETTGLTLRTARTHLNKLLAWGMASHGSSDLNWIPLFPDAELVAITQGISGISKQRSNDYDVEREQYEDFLQRRDLAVVSVVKYAAK